MTEATKKLFKEYEQAFNALDVAKQVPMFMVKVHWGATFKKTGDKLVEFDVTYFIQNPDTNPKIIMFIAHQDEEKAMKELGLM